MQGNSGSTGARKLRQYMCNFQVLFDTFGHGFDLGIKFFICVLGLFLESVWQIDLLRLFLDCGDPGQLSFLMTIASWIPRQLHVSAILKWITQLQHFDYKRQYVRLVVPLH